MAEVSAPITAASLQKSLQAQRNSNWHHSIGLGGESSSPVKTTATMPQLSTTGFGAGSSLAVSKTAWTPQLRTTMQHIHLPTQKPQHKWFANGLAWQP
uniref:Uncharacterized protein n=1 Tax=Caenorhabditis japonica TaxID=281687 RepID=A0A2Q4T0T3_CAEJA